MINQVTKRNAAFQQWQTLLTNRTKRHRAGEFLLQGVRPIQAALEHSWQIRTWIHVDRDLSDWAEDTIAAAPAATRYALSADLFAELSEKEESSAELIAIVAIPADDLDRIPTSGPAVVFDRPTSPGNIGSMVRSIDAFGGSGLIVTGHAADPYDPKALRATTGSFFAVPVVRTNSVDDIVAWTHGRRGRVIGTDETGSVSLPESHIRANDTIVIGNETRGMSSAWHDACDEIISIPMTGWASSLNAASAATVVLYQAYVNR